MAKVDNIKGTEKPVIRPVHPPKPANPAKPQGKVDNVDK